ncbi:hypothetical protein QFZ42_000123 [Variovorax paradoxus]|uniref:hypothetical protein n=1 Tax=Variovorax paradoxus TaxID=34073 RepID=UPI00279152E4|nr:hypothetical protein [Variovorax paradoxus]MDQ0568289.1 hypothetical protein [Variovorax paradoxus]
MSGGGHSSKGFDGDDALHGAALRRALDHAPDRDAMPDPRTRDAIRKMAHNLAPVPATVPVAAAPWWRRWFGGGEAHSRMPWNAAFATVLVATFVTVLWYREPIPDARLDGEAQVGGTAAPAPVQPPAPSPAAVAPTPQAPAAQDTAPVRPAPQAAEPARGTANEQSAKSRGDALRKPAPAPAGKQTGPTQEIDRKTSEVPPAPVLAAPAPAPAPAPASVAEQSATESRAFPRTEERRSTESERDRARAVGGTPAMASASPAAPMVLAAPPSMERESRDGSAPALSAQRNANAEPSGALRQAPAPRAAAAAGAASPQGDTSTFSALDGWTSFNYLHAGQAVRHVRGDVEGLAASVNSVARSATVAGSDLAAPVEARLELYRGTAQIAVLEIAGDQVRWTPQAGGRPSVGTPPASALAALRALLTRQ